MAFLAGEVRHEQILERGLGAFRVWKVSEKEFFTSRQRRLHDKRKTQGSMMWLIAQNTVRLWQKMSLVRAVSERASCATVRSLDCMWQAEPLSACE